MLQQHESSKCVYLQKLEANKSYTKFRSLEGLYIRPEMKSTRYEISTHHERNSVSITFLYGRNEMNFVSGMVRDKWPIK